MTLAAELVGAYLGGIVSLLVTVALGGPRFVRWYMKRKLGGMLNLTAASMKMRDAPQQDGPLYVTRPESLEALEP